MLFKKFRKGCQQFENNLGIKMSVPEKITAFIVITESGKIMFFAFIALIGLLITIFI